MKKFLFLFLFLALSYRDVIAAGPIIMNPGGQALSSTDSPTFAGLTLNGALVMGANSIQFTDSTLIRDAANVLALRNGVNAQQLSIYNTFTDASNYERLELLWSSNTATIRAAAAGTGTLRNLNFTPAGLGRGPSGDGGVVADDDPQRLGCDGRRLLGPRGHVGPVADAGRDHRRHLRDPFDRGRGSLPRPDER